MFGEFIYKDISFTYQNTSYVLGNLSFADDAVETNLTKLFERKKGDLLRVNDEGMLVEVKGWKERISYFCHHKQEVARVKDAIDNALQELNLYLSKLEDQKVAEAAVKYLFDKNGERGIGRLGKALYTHRLLKCDNFLSKYVMPANYVRLKIAEDKFVDITGKKFANKAIPFPLEFVFGDEKCHHNLWMLLKRKKGQIYQVNAEGKLEKVKREWRFFEPKSEQDKKVQQVVTQVITSLNSYLHAREAACQIEQLVLSSIFSSDSPLCRMSRETFDRGAIKEDSFLEKLLRPSLETKRAALARSLKVLRDAENTEEREAGKRHVETAFLELTFCEFEFAQRLGLDLALIGDGGSGGARFAFDRHGRKILVIKPGDEGPLGVNNPKWYARLKRFLISPKPCLEGNPEEMAEVDSWLWDRSFSIWSVPPTDIRYVSSRTFIGSSYKECSVQMFVEKCMTLGDYVGISPKVQWLPRIFLRWYSGSRFNTGPFYAPPFGQRENRKEELLNKLPQHLMERVAIHNMGIEDIDCHFENILVKISEVVDEESMIKRIFEGGDVEDESIDEYVQHFFTAKGNQELLGQLLYSEPLTVGEDDLKSLLDSKHVASDNPNKRITLIKHDGGASNPHSHPGWWDFLSLRYKHLFEVLPHFEAVFSYEGKQLIENKADVLAKFVLEKAMRHLQGILTPEVFKAFWSLEDNRKLFKQWVFETDARMEYPMRLQLIPQLFRATNEDPDVHGSYFQFYFNHHLKRIRGNIKTRIDSFRVLEAFAKKNTDFMRELFKNVRTKEDFERELEGLEDSYSKIFDEQKTSDVQKGNLQDNEFESLTQSTLIHTLGVALG